MTRQVALNWADRAIVACLLLLAMSTPVSIAATQSAWAFGLLFWIIRTILRPSRPRLELFDIAVFAFIGLSLVSSFFSYEPRVSLAKMVAVSLFTIVYLVSRSAAPRTVRWMVVLTLSAAFVSTLWTFGVLAVGKNLKVTRMTPDSVLRKAGMEDGDTILKVNGRVINTPEDVTAALDVVVDPKTSIEWYRHELIIDSLVPVIHAQEDAATALGIEEWHRGRDTRAQGFFGHYTTYAEALQLIASLGLGLFLTVGRRPRVRLLLAIALVAYSAALFLTVTRASWAGFALSAAVMIVLGASRKVLLISALCAVPIAAAGLYYLQQKRNVGMVDTTDMSTTWRGTVWREGFDVLISSPRHLAVGIGMDSLKTHWQDWGMFDNGNLPLGHLHSDPLQIAFERGVPALVAWVMWMLLYLGLLWRGLREPWRSPLEKGLLLGSFGGTIGFLASGLVHYNWGDSEVVMIFYLLMGLSIAILRTQNIDRTEPHGSTT